jgi:uncharacterized membrane protein
VRAALWSGILLLILVGVAATVNRTVHVTDAAVRLELARQRILPSTPRFIPDPAARMREVTDFDAPFALHPRTARLHVLTGAAFLLLAPLQFVTPIRRRYARVHRWTGRALLVFGCLTGLSGLYFGLLMPFAGPRESAAIALAGGLFFLSMARAFLAIRAGEVARHREWMIRAFAVAVGISTVRVMGGILDTTLTPAGFSVREIFVGSVWLGWVVTVATAEIWIRRTRQDMVS